jgi:hypothetical protein
MRIEVLEDRLSDMDADTGHHYVLEKGDTITVPDAYGARICARGWAKDVDGKAKTGERKPGAEVLAPKKKVVPSRGRARG